jgi:LacI family transcriptional regulator
MAAKKPITIKHVAREAGVSPQTVSRVFNDHPDVARETRQRVQKVIAELGYQPNAIARGLIKQRSHTLGVVIAELDQYGLQRLLVGVERRANELGYSLLLRLVHEPELDRGEQLVRDLLARQVEGIIWAIPEIGDNLSWLQDRTPGFAVPLIFIGGEPQSHFPLVSIDTRNGGRLATEHLLSQGYRHIGLITGPLTWGVSRRRQLGWQEALSMAGLPPTDNQIVEGDWPAASGERGLHQLLARYPQLEAVFACNDQMALGVLRAAQQLGRRVPEDLAVVGFDNIPEAAYFWSPLTSVRQRLIDLGTLAVQQMHQMIEAKQEDEEDVSLPPTAMLLQPELVVRESSIKGGEAPQ